jgi:GTPase SAR1 family protein
MDYAKTSAQLAQDLAMIKEFSQQVSLNNSLDLIEQVACRLREHRFTVAVVGEFKTGKSTFVNALLGVDVVPTDVIPATATLNRLTYGMDSSIEVLYKDGHRHSVGFDKLKEFVTKEFVTTDLLDTIDEVVIHHPAPYLLNNVDIIDTPGLNDESSMTSVSLSVLPKTDAAILVISGLSPFSDYTRQFLEERLLSSDLGRVVFLVNRLGQLGSPENADKIVSHIEKRIAQNVIDRAKRDFGENSPEYEVYVKKIGKPRVFGIDAHDALEGIVNNDKALLERSRFPAFQNGLRRFLNDDRGAIVLQVPVNRILASVNEILLTLNLRRQTAKMSLEEFNQKRDTAVEELNRIRERKSEDMLEVDRKKAEAYERARAVLKGLDDRVKAAVRDAIAGVALSDDEAAKGKPAADKVQSAINIEIRTATEREAERVAAEVNRTVSEVADQLQKLTADLEQTVKGIVLNFGSGSGGGVRGEQVGAAALGAAGLVLGGFGVVGGVVSGYKQAGLVGAVTGGAVAYGALYAAASIALAIGLPLSLPVMFAAGLLGFFSSDKITKALFTGSRAKTFKEKAIEQTLKQIDEMHLEADMVRSTKTYIDEVFSRLGKSVSADVDAVIGNTQRTLDELARQKERHDVLTEEQVRDLDQIEQRTKSIQERTAVVNKMLTARMAGAAL